MRALKLIETNSTLSAVYTENELWGRFKLFKNLADALDYKKFYMKNRDENEGEESNDEDNWEHGISSDERDLFIKTGEIDVKDGVTVRIGSQTYPDYILGSI